MWWKPKNINEENPKTITIITMNLNAPYKTIKKSVSDGVFDVNYLRNVAFSYAVNN